MILRSPAFKSGGSIPEKYTCAGDSVNPALSIKGVPKGTGSLALIMESSGSAERRHIHWIVFNISPVSSIRENSIPGLQGTNSFFAKRNYAGPCPWQGRSRYSFKMYALDSMLELNEGAFKEELIKAMRGHILAEAELIGFYARQRVPG